MENRNEGLAVSVVALAVGALIGKLLGAIVGYLSDRAAGR